MVSARSPPSITPSGLCALAPAIALRTCSSEIPAEAAAPGLTRTRTAGCSAPLTVTSATPGTCAMRCATTVSAAS
jgi:hypothetical protein